MSESEEWVKAIQDGSKAVVAVAEGYTTTVKSTEKMGRFLSNIFGTTIENGAGIIGDKLEFIRWERQNRMIDRVNEYQREKGSVQCRSIPPKFAIPMIVNASLEEEDDLQDIWCKLISNSLDPNFDVEIRYAFIEIIKNLTSLDAKILKYMCEGKLEVNKINQTRKIRVHPIDSCFIRWNVQASYEEIEISLVNLKRVQCIWDDDITEIRSDISNIMHVKQGSSVRDSRYKITPLGEAFVLACLK